MHQQHYPGAATADQLTHKAAPKTRLYIRNTCSPVCHDKPAHSQAQAPLHNLVHARPTTFLQTTNVSSSVQLHPASTIQQLQTSNLHLLSGSSTPELLCYEWLGIKVLVAQSIQAANEAIQLLLTACEDNVLAIDTESTWDSSGSKRGDMIQLATDNVVVLIRHCRFGHVIPPALVELLQRQSITFVGLSLQGFIDRSTLTGAVGMSRQLRKAYWHQTGAAILPCHVDLMLTGKSLKDLAWQLLSLNISKTVPRGSSWKAKELSQSQVAYAALDALATKLAYNKLLQLPYEEWPARTDTDRVRLWNKVQHLNKSR